MISHKYNKLAKFVTWRKNIHVLRDFWGNNQNIVLKLANFVKSKLQFFAVIKLINVDEYNLFLTFHQAVLFVLTMQQSLLSGFRWPLCPAPRSQRWGRASVRTDPPASATEPGPQEYGAPHLRTGPTVWGSDPGGMIRIIKIGTWEYMFLWESEICDGISTLSMAWSFFGLSLPWLAVSCWAVSRKRISFCSLSLGMLHAGSRAPAWEKASSAARNSSWYCKACHTMSLVQTLNVWISLYCTYNALIVIKIRVHFSDCILLLKRHLM